MSSLDPKSCIYCDEMPQYENGPLCKDCLNNLKTTQKRIKQITLAYYATNNDTTKRLLAQELGELCLKELRITNKVPQLRDLTFFNKEAE